MGEGFLLLVCIMRRRRREEADAVKPGTGTATAIPDALSIHLRCSPSHAVLPAVPAGWNTRCVRTTDLASCYDVGQQADVVKGMGT